MMLRDGCILCFPTGHGTAHDGEHLIRPVYGGKASCPVDEQDDPDLGEELGWVALEAALQDAGWDLSTQGRLFADVRDCLIGRPFCADGLQLWHAGHQFQWTVRTDEHLEGAAGTLDLLCTITGPLTAVPA